MASVAGRKKSIVSSAGLQIDAPVANNTLLNQQATTSLYQECSRLRARLMCIRGFQMYFDFVSDNSTDPVTHLWDLFSFGIPLCYIFDQLPASEGFNKINNSSFDPEKYEANPDRAKKHAIALFAMQIRSDKVTQNIPDCELFTVTDLWDRRSNDGLVKVVKTVAAIVKHLPEDAFDDPPPSPPFMSTQDSYESLNDSNVSLGAREVARNNIVRELVETERKYVQDLEIMQKYATALSQSNAIDQDTIHLLFPNLNQLLNFQRKFLIKFESTAEMPWHEQRWGQHFLTSEDEFIAYEPYCANYTAASELALANEQNLSSLNLMDVKELQAFLIKPIQRVCKYPLLLDSLTKAASSETYPHYDELKAGLEAAKRIADKINEAQRHAENEQTVKNLQSRVDDWKGHHLENFGRLLLDDIFTVTKSDIDREYHVFLFEKIILCCKEAPQLQQNGRKVGKSNSILKKQGTPPSLNLPGSNVSLAQRKTTPLLLKGRIFLGNVTQAVPVSARNSMSSSVPVFPLAVWWRGDDDLEFFTLRCKREEQMRQWETTINRLIKETAQRKASERGLSRIANSTNPAASRYNQYNPNSLVPGYPQALTMVNGGRRAESLYRDDQSSSNGSAYGGGPQGYPPHDGFDVEENEDEFEDYPPTSSATYTTSGRGTPIGARRGTSSMPPEREQPPPGYERPRAHTEGVDGPALTQWRNNGPSSAVVRPVTPRLNSNISNMSAGSDASFGNNARRPPLRSQFSSTKLRSGYQENGSGDFRNGVPQNVPPPSSTPPLMNRSRSASQPSAYIPKAHPPPLPSVPQWQPSSQSSSSISTSHKRGSGSSQSTGDSSDYSPNSSSPITPFGSSESSLGLRQSRSQNFENAVNGVGHAPYPHPVKVKVHFHEDIFVIQVPRETHYDDLVEKVGRKIRLCGPRRDDGPLRVKYRDEDGDMVSLGSTEDVQMAFEQYRPGGQVILFVT